MMQLWDKRGKRHVYTTCIQPFTPYKRKRSHIKVRCVTKDEGEELINFLITVFAIVFWIAFCVLFVRWWLV